MTMSIQSQIQRLRAARKITAVASYSGGVSSWAATKRYVDENGTDGLVLLFADTIAEHPTTYRFLIQGAANILGVEDRHSHRAMGLPSIDKSSSVRPAPRLQATDALFRDVCADMPKLVRIRDGRNPWQVFADERFIGNSKSDPCSLILKRELMDEWQGMYASDAIRIIGLDYTEMARFARYASHAKNAVAPMMEEPYMDKGTMIEWAVSEGLTIADSYRLGFNHDNCSRRCCKAGQGHWAQVFTHDREAFNDAETEENSLRRIVGNYSHLKDRTGGTTKVLSLSMFRERLETGVGHVDRSEIGGCACALE